ncbi:hypothetical protein TASIC1_0016000300 [Trichoderma asperellum]|uniref:Uncharacterized protein n=1 Tax=Trichoderma asperellum TaxID=101201 RepID=A0A6V8R7L7_TRIAP|nr:hypothetical protein TASIC1_0016000300 [Trichoderma asperellum]
MSSPPVASSPMTDFSAVMSPSMTSPVFPKPKKLSFADINIPNDYPYDLTFGTPDYEDTIAVLNAYYSQATRMTADDQLDMVEIIESGKYLKTASARTSGASHRLYRKAQERNFAPESISWANFLTLNALYGYKLPVKYPEAVRKRFGTRAVQDFSEEYFDIYPKASHILPTSADGETSDVYTPPVTRKRSRESEEDMEQASASASTQPRAQPRARKQARFEEAPLTDTSVPPTLPARTAQETSSVKVETSAAHLSDQIIRANRSVDPGLFARQGGLQMSSENVGASQPLFGRLSAPERLFAKYAIPRPASQHSFLSEMRERNWAQANTSNDQGACNMPAEATSTDGSRQEMSAPDAEIVDACPENQEANMTPISTISQGTPEWDIAGSFECARSTNSPTPASTSANTRNEEETSSDENSTTDNSSSKWNEDVMKSISDMKLLFGRENFRLHAKIDIILQNTFDNTVSIEKKIVSEMAKLKTELKAEIQAVVEAVVEAVVQAVLSKKEADRAAILKDIQSFMKAIVERLEEN